MNSVQSWPHMIVGDCSCPMVHSAAEIRVCGVHVRMGVREEVKCDHELNQICFSWQKWAEVTPSLFLLSAHSQASQTVRVILKLLQSIPVCYFFKEMISFKGIVHTKVELLSLLFTLIFIWPHIVFMLRLFI